MATTTGFFTRPDLEDRQFRQLSNSILTLSGETNFAGVLKSKGIEIDASTGGTSAGYALIWNGTNIALAPSSGGGQEYTGGTPSNITVGGLDAGTTLSGRSLSDIVEEMLITTLSSTVVGPSHTLTENESPNTQEIGNNVLFNLTSCFSRGSITPQYDSNGDCIASSAPRSGLANNYCYTGPAAFSCLDASSSCSNTIPTASYDLTQGSNTWSSCVLYDASTTTVYDSDGNITNAPLGAGNTSTKNVSLTGQYYRFYGPSSSQPTNSAEVRALPVTEFQTANVNTFTLDTGTVETTFYVALPPGRTISQVIDQTALGTDITSEYVDIGNVTVKDGGGTGTDRTYKLYEMSLGAAYSENHEHDITTA